MTRIEQGLLPYATTWFGPFDGKKINLAYWTRNIEGLHFDVIVQQYNTESSPNRLWEISLINSGKSSRPAGDAANGSQGTRKRQRTELVQLSGNKEDIGKAPGYKTQITIRIRMLLHEPLGMSPKLCKAAASQKSLPHHLVGTYEARLGTARPFLRMNHTGITKNGATLKSFSANMIG